MLKYRMATVHIIAALFRLEMQQFFLSLLLHHQCSLTSSECQGLFIFQIKEREDFTE